MNKVTKTSGITFIDLLAIAFIVLKLTGKINWSWLWVLSPIWITATIYIVQVVCLYMKYSNNE